MITIPTLRVVAELWDTCNIISIPIPRIVIGLWDAHIMIPILRVVAGLWNACVIISITIPRAVAGLWNAYNMVLIPIFRVVAELFVTDRSPGCYEFQGGCASAPQSECCGRPKAKPQQ